MGDTRREYSGVPEDVTRCAAVVREASGWHGRNRQCTNPRNNGILCGVHARKKYGAQVPKEGSYVEAMVRDARARYEREEARVSKIRAELAEAEATANKWSLEVYKWESRLAALSSSTKEPNDGK